MDNGRLWWERLQANLSRTIYRRRLARRSLYRARGEGRKVLTRVRGAGIMALDECEGIQCAKFRDAAVAVYR